MTNSNDRLDRDDPGLKPTRFERLVRLTGQPALDLLERSFVVVLGLGGVGSFTAEALARSGIGRLRLLDYDHVCITNTNRQLHALESTVGLAKAEVMADRLRQVNPNAIIEPAPIRYAPDAADWLLEERPDFVVDAIDQITLKCHLIATCHAHGLAVVSSMGAAGRLDPTRICVSDLAESHHDAMAANVRKILRNRHGFPRQGRFGVPVVFSDEPIKSPHVANDVKDAARDGSGDGRAPRRQSIPDPRNGSRVPGSASFVTGAFGLAAASVVVRTLISRDAAHPSIR